LTSVTIPDSVTSIGDSAFDGCTLLASVTIPNSVTSIGVCAFENCTSLTSVTIPNGVTSIGEETFFECPSLTSVTIPNSVMRIGADAFHGCTSLTNITIPNGVTSISDDAFYGCTSLTTVYGYTGSYAETYARSRDYTFIALDLVKNDETDISVVFPPENLPAENTVLNVEKLSAEENAITYDITLIVNGENAQPASTVTVKIPVPEAMDGAQCKVYRQEPDGTYTDMQAIYQNGYMVFTTDHFSTYVLTTADPNVPTYTLGDVNGDEKVNAVDARWVLQAASGARTFDATQTAAADVNSDGKINAVDARWILQAASGARVL
ncbi:MAG: leucine-rich repeat protein, partial [Candidatus Fimenecus sp.]